MMQDYDDNKKQNEVIFCQHKEIEALWLSLGVKGRRRQEVIIGFL